MASADVFRSSTTRPVGLRRRGDLITTRQVYQGQAWWVVKDPIALSYFRFRPEEYALLDMLDGEASLEDLKDQFEARFPPRRIKLDELARFVATLHRSGLVIGDRPGQGPQLFERRRQKTLQQWKSWLGNVLALRFRGIDPDKLLTRLDPWLGWLFEPPAIVAMLVFAASALLLVLVNFDTFQAKLPEFHQFFASGNWLYLAIALAFTKVFHEFGHGLSCKHYGGECHEMGVMMLVFTPCLYCDVSDSWMLPSKWKRAAIGAAGMYVEVILASIATFLWWNSHGGIFNQLCLDVMFVSSVSTLLFNANPLLRYDGYYILSDLLEIPNLKQKAKSITSRIMSKWCLGIKQPDDPFLPQRRLGLFALYAVASGLYGWFVSLSIFLFVWNVFKPYRLEVIGQFLAFMALWGLVVRPVQGMIKFLNIPGRRDEVKALNVTITRRDRAHSAAPAGVVRGRIAAAGRGDGVCDGRGPPREPGREGGGARQAGRRAGPAVEHRPRPPDRGARGEGVGRSRALGEPGARAVHRPGGGPGDRHGGEVAQEHHRAAGEET
jgi:putative peptide zinc metalloprotease protein